MKTEYWVWLQQVLGFADDAIHRVLSVYKDAESFYRADDTEKISACHLKKAQVERLHKVSRKTVYSIIKECEKTGINIVTPDSKAYPEMLKNIPDMPTVLYVKGDASVLSALPAVAVIGPRKISDYGSRVTYTVANTLASCGFTVISGGALGGDSAAHLGAIDGKGKTVAVLGCGINADYLMENSDLRKRVSENGCLVSEYPPLEKAGRGSFPKRNRLISGLANGVAVTEAGEKSGTLITARLAAEQGRDVFAMPGSTSDPGYIGSNRLIADGAKPLLNINDIINEYLYMYPDKIHPPKSDGSFKIVEKAVPVKPKAEKPQKGEPPVKEKAEEPAEKSAAAPADMSVLSDTAKKIYGLLPGGEFTADDISPDDDLGVGDILSALTELEIFGFVSSCGGGRYHTL